MDQAERDALERWNAIEAVRDRSLYLRVKPMNFIEISRIPKKIDARTLTSMLVTASKIVPKSVQICYRGAELEVIGIVEYKTATEAYRAADKVRSSLFCKGWNLKLMEEPEYSKPEMEVVNKLASYH